MEPTQLTRQKPDIGREIDQWQARGLIDPSTADRLRTDVATRAASQFSLVSRVTLIGGAFLCAAMLLFIAANWEAMPRLLRLALIFSVIATGFIGGAVLKQRGREALGECAWLIACTTFGAGIALVGQMYHLSGDEADALILWGALTALSAALLRSGPLSVGVVLIGCAWLVYTASAQWSLGGVFVYYPAFALALWALCAWTDSRVGRHLLLLSLSLYVAILQFWLETPVPSLFLAAAAVALFIYSHKVASEDARFLPAGEGGSVHAIVGYGVAFLLLHLEYGDSAAMFLIAALFIAGIVLALILEGRHSRTVRWTAYAALTLETAFLYVALLGSMLGTAGFLFCAGLLMIAAGWLIARVEHRHATSGGSLAR